MEGEGGVGVVDQWDRGESHEGSVTALDLDSKKKKVFFSSIIRTAKRSGSLSQRIFLSLPLGE